LVKNVAGMGLWVKALIATGKHGIILDRARNIYLATGCQQPLIANHCSLGASESCFLHEKSRIFF
jgi:hypothetical protein